MGLSERKTKERYGLDPRNTFWQNDKSKFGLRMLQKMGWQEGTGLGLSGTGQVDHVKMTVKHDNYGIGANRKTDDNIDISNDFDGILSRLASKMAAKNEEKGEETIVMSKPSPEEIKPSVTAIQSRLSHRSRFRKMKYMAVTDAQSLNEIFGVRSVGGSPTEPQVGFGSSNSSNNGNGSVESPAPESSESKATRVALKAQLKADKAQYRQYKLMKQQNALDSPTKLKSLKARIKKTKYQIKCTA